VAGERIKGETDAAYRAFCRYRDLPSDSRTRRRAYHKHCEERGYEPGYENKHQPGNWNRWADDNNWKERARDWDISRSKDALREFILARNADIQRFIEHDFTIMKLSQQVARKIMIGISKDDRPDASTYRQAMMGYNTNREALKDLIGIGNEHANQTARRAESDSD